MLVMVMVLVLLLMLMLLLLLMMMMMMMFGLFCFQRSSQAAQLLPKVSGASPLVRTPLRGGRLACSAALPACSALAPALALALVLDSRLRPPVQLCRSPLVFLPQLA